MATQDPTTRYGWDLPNVDGDTGVWGEKLNAIIGDDVTGIDERLYDTTVTADAALPKSGGTMTGTLKTKVVTESPVNISASAIDCALGNFFYKTLTGSVTFTITNPPLAGTVQFLTLELTNAGTRITWPGTVKWQDGVAPTFTTDGVDIVVMYTRNGGSPWYAAHAISDPS